MRTNTFPRAPIICLISPGGGSPSRRTNTNHDELEVFTMTTDDLRDLPTNSDDTDTSYVAGGLTFYLLGC